MHLRVGLVSFVLLSSAFQAQAQDPTLKSDSRAVVLDVVVTKGNGEPVQGLSKQDFEMLEDGKSQSISFFEEHSGGVTAPAPRAPLPANSFGNQQLVAPGDAVNVLLLDGLNTPKAEQAAMLERLEKYIRKMPEGTPVAIFSLAGQLHLVHGFTGDRAALLAALEEKQAGLWPKKMGNARTPQSDAEDRGEVEIEKTMTAPSSPLSAGEITGSSAITQAELASQGQRKGQQNDESVAATLTALRTMGSFLEKVPGRKNLIWFASSFPVAFLADSEGLGSLKANDQSRGLKEMADLLALARIAIYPVGVRGVDGQSWSEAAGGPGLSFGDMAAENNAFAANNSAMEQWANETGGAVIHDNYMDAALAHAIEDGSHYYTISYTPGNTRMDGKFRRFKVKLEKGNYHLEYRRGYYALESFAPSRPLADPLQPMLLRGFPGNAQLPIEVRIQAANPQPDAKAPRAGANQKLSGHITRYNIDFTVHWKDEAPDASPDGHHLDKFQVEVFAYNQEGVALNWVGGAMTMNASAANYAQIQKSGFPAHMVLDVPEGEVYLAAGVYDWNAGKAGTLEIPVSSLTGAGAVK